MPLIAVAPPYKEFIPGQGLPDVPKEGVLVSDEQDAAIRAIADASGNANLRLLGYVYEEAFDETLASKAYIEQRFVAITADIGAGYSSISDMVDAAAVSAGDAATSEANAATHAAAAGTSADEADTHRAAAAVSESNAADAEAGAQTAKGQAEAARDIAVDAAATATAPTNEQVDARIALQKGEPNGLLPADENGLLPESRVPERLTPSGLSASTDQRIIDTVSPGAATPQAAVDARVAVGVPAATTATPGRVELATTAETIAGIDTTRAVSPGTARAAYVRAGIIGPGVNGIVGDGVTIDRAAIQAVLDAHKYVWVLPGTYLVDTVLTVPDGTTIEGPGRSAIFRSTSNPTSGGTGVGQRLFDATGKNGFRLVNFHCDMTPVTTFSGGLRCVWLNGSNDFELDGLTFDTPGAAYAATNCYDYRVINPVADIASSDGVAHHDGIFDQWDSCHDFEVINPIVNGNGIAKYGVLVTGESTTGVPGACYNFAIIHPKVYDVIQLGVWVSGREGVNHTFTIVEPLVDGVSTYHGIAISDSYAWTLSSPVTKNTGANGIRVYVETSAGGVEGADHGTISDPVVYNANTGLSASETDGAAIAILDGCDGVVLTTPRVKGSTHTYAVAFGTAVTKCVHVPGSYDTGTLGKVYNDPAGGTYTPTVTGVANVSTVTASQAVWTREADLVTVRGRLVVTPTAGSSTATQVGISLPVASNLASTSTDLFGTGATQFGQIAAINADVTNDRAQLQYPAPGTAGYVFYYSFTYRVL